MFVTIGRSKGWLKMAGSKRRLVIVGAGETAELAHYYFSSDSGFQVVGFSVERPFMENGLLLGLPVVPFEEVERYFAPKEHSAFIAVSYTQLNRVRQRLFKNAKIKGYQLVSYLSSKACIAENVHFGENCFVLENTTIQRGARVGDNVTIWSGSSIGHRTSIGDNCFIASQVALSGFCAIGDNCFFGVNSCTSDKLTVAGDCVVGAGAVLVKDTEKGKVYVGNPARPIANKNTDSFITGEEMI